MASRMQRSNDETVVAKTGRTWGDWFAILDDAGAATLAHRDIAAALQSDHDIPAWWAQSITVEYERARGLRDVHQTTRGYEVSVSKTIDAPPDSVWAALTQPALVAKWVDRPFNDRGSKQAGTVRADFDGSTSNLTLGCNNKGIGRTQVVIVQSKLPNHDAVETQRAYWRVAIERLETLFS